MPGLDRRAHRLAEIDACDRAAGAGRLPAVDRKGEGGAVEPFLQPRRDKADDARAASLRPPTTTAAPRSSSPSDSSASASASASVAISICWRARLSRSSSAAMSRAWNSSSGGQQPGAQARVADPPAGVDARADEEAQMIGSRRPVRAGDIEESRQSRTGGAGA